MIGLLLRWYNNGKWILNEHNEFLIQADEDRVGGWERGHWAQDLLLVIVLG